MGDVEAHWAGVDCVPVPQVLCDVDAVVGQDGVDLVGHGLEHVLEELPGRLSVSRGNELSDGELGRPVDTDEEKELALGRLNFGDVDVEEAYGVALELLPCGLVSIDIRKARNAMTLRAPVQCGPCQVRDRRLQGIEAVIQWQQRVAPEIVPESFGTDSHSVA